MFLKRFNQQGLSFMEIMVTISIIVIVLSISSVNYRNSNRRLELTLFTRKVVSDLRLMQSNAASAKNFGAVAQNVWGVYFNPSNSDYKMFVDRPDGSFPDNRRYETAGSGELHRLISLPKSLSLKEIKGKKQGDSGFTDVTELHLTFAPPDPDTIMLDSSGNKYDEVCLSFENKQDNNLMYIHINYFGLIEDLKNNVCL